MKARRGRSSRPIRTGGVVALPLLAAALYHVLTGGVVMYIVAAGALALAGLFELVHRRRDASFRVQAAAAGQQAWRASAPVASFSWASQVSRVWMALRDVVPVTAMVTRDDIEVHPATRYQKLGFTDQRIPLTRIRRVTHESAGHTRPDGTLSSALVLTVIIEMKDGSKFDLSFDHDGAQFARAVKIASSPTK